MTVRLKPIRLAATIGAAALAATAVATAQPANAAITCMSQAAWSSTSLSGSALMTVPSASQCSDLNASSARSADDRVKGWYQSGGTWYGGSAGYVFVPKVENGWKVLLGGVANGAYVKGTTMYLSQNVQYIY